MLTTTDARGNVTTSFYDNAGRRTKVRNALNQETTFAYDANGNQLTMTDALLRTTTFEYDDNNRRTKITYHDSSFETVGYDALGRSVSKTDQAGKTTQFTYDALGIGRTLPYSEPMGRCEQADRIPGYRCLWFTCEASGAGIWANVSW